MVAQKTIKYHSFTSACATALVRVTISTEESLMSSGIPNSPAWFPVAVQALVVIAGTEGACSSGAMAQDLKAHAVFVRRVLAQLVRAEIVQAREGRDGGYRLARSADNITLAEVYQAVKTPDTSEDTVCSKGVNTRVQNVLDEIGVEVEQRLLEVLGSYTLASIVDRVTISNQPT
jgi:Rrf2 family protein